MASESKSEDEILGIDSSKDLGTDSSKIDDDISCLDEDMLLLNSPPSSCPAPGSAAKSNKRKATSASSQPAKKLSTGKTHHVLGISDNDDELEIIEDDNDEVEEITDVNDLGSGSDSNMEEEEDEDVDELEDSLSGESDQESDEEPGDFLDGKINIFHCHGSFFLWNADDVQMLREECRIIGKLTGSLPRAPRQNSHLGLPLQLMPEEAKLLVDIDAAVVVTEEPVAENVMSIREAAFQNVRATNFKIQQQLFKDSRQEDVKKRMNDIIAGKKAKKQKVKKGAVTNVSTLPDVADNKHNVTNDVQDKTSADSQMTAAAGPGDNAIVTDETENGSKTEPASEDHLTVDDIISESADTSEQHCLVQIFTENPWKRNFRPYFEWPYPATDRETLRYQVFKDLWGKGFYLTSGVKFGADFLVYPGDPARFHSHYLAVCKSQAEEVTSLDIITYGRQASNVRKTALLCSLDRSRKVFYTSLQWTGLS